MNNITISCPADNYFTFNDYKTSNNDKLYFITITRRNNKETDICTFKDNLTEVLAYTSYPGKLRGVIEYADKHNGYHFHGITDWKYKHFNEKNTGFYARVIEVKEGTLQFILRYITKTFRESRK